LGLTEASEAISGGSSYVYKRGSTAVVNLTSSKLSIPAGRGVGGTSLIINVSVTSEARKLFPPAAQATQRPAQQTQRPAQQAQRPAQQTQRPAQQAQRPAAQTAQKPAAQQAPTLRITNQPQAQTVKQGQMAMFSVAAHSSGTPTYQWEIKRRSDSKFAPLMDGGKWSGTKNRVLRINDVHDRENGAQFRCVVTDAGKSVTSNAATLTVTRP